jgi:cell division protein FtsL
MDEAQSRGAQENSNARKLFGRKIKGRHIVLAACALLFALVLGVTTIGPAITGYAVYQNVKSSGYSVDDYGKNINDMELQVSNFMTNISACNNFNDKLLAELRTYVGNITQCRDRISQQQIEIASLEKDIENAQNAEDSKSAELKALSENYDLLARNAANNICCKMRVDDPEINSYRIENSRIICSKGEPLNISC